MKRPDRQLYRPPALRSSFNKDCEEEMERERWNLLANSLRNRDSLQRRSANVIRIRERIDSYSSSSNPRSISDKSCKDDESSDFEECCGKNSDPVTDQENSIATSEIYSNNHWNEEAENHTKSNHIRTTTKSPANTMPNPKHDKRLLYSSDDSIISDIESMIDNQLHTGRFLTSISHSNILEQKVLDAAKYDSNLESRLKSTLLGQSGNLETAINTNRSKCDYNFEICHPSSNMSQSKTFSEIFGKNYISPPVSPTLPLSRLPPIHRLPTPGSVLRHVSPQKTTQLHTQSLHPRLLCPPSLQLYSNVPRPSSFDSSNLSNLVQTYVPRHAFSQSFQSSPSSGLDTRRMSSSIPIERFSPPHQDASNSLYLHQRNPTFQSLNSSGSVRNVMPTFPLRAPNPRRTTSSIPPPHSTQERFHLPHPLDLSSSVFLHQQKADSLTLELYKQYDSLYIPPPVTSIQQLNRSQQIRNLNQYAIVQSSQPSTSVSDKIDDDDETWQH